MPSKFEFDDTRNAIGADKLENSERKAMLDKFKSAGGKVLSEKELRENKRLENQQKQNSKQGQSRSRHAGGFNDEDSASSQSQKKDAKKDSGSLTKLILKLRTFFAGLTPFSADAIKPGFFEYMGLEVKQAVVEFNLIGNDLFLINKDIGKKVAKGLDQKNPVLIELLQKLHSLYDSKQFNNLLDFHQSNPGALVPFQLVEDPLKNIFKKLYYIYPFQETLKKAVNLAVDIYVKETDDENNKNLMDQKKKKFLKDINEVFLKAFPKLFLLICRFDGVEYTLFSQAFEKMIGINPDEKIGKRKQGDSSSLAGSLENSGEESDNEESASEGENTGEDAESEQEKEKENVSAISLTKEYQYGLKLMRQNPLPALRKKHDPHNNYMQIQYFDRAFLSYLFFLEFDKELSFVLTTKKIRLSPDYSSGTKKDYKQILADAFNQSRSVIQAFENYVQERKTFQSYESSHGSSANYVEASKRKEQARSKMDMEGRNVRGLIRTYMDNVTKILATLITDMKTKKVIVENMDEPLQFDSEFEGSKRLNGQPVKQCILEAYCYSLALCDRLTGGDLFGGILDMTDEEMIASFGSTFKDNPV